MPEHDALRQQQRCYWRKTMAVTVLLLFVWFCVTFVTSFFSEWLNQWSFVGLPLGYFFAAQGVLLVYLLLIAIYALWMNRLDRRFGVDEQ